ncbi:MAG: hypothetical protein KKB37_17320 [Alphaproteobacteria bacterium]|nr:hypothetical protein [Alphaproteobacteria bacterium]
MSKECFSCAFLGTETCIHPGYAAAYTKACADYEPREEARQEALDVDPERYFRDGKFVPALLAVDLMKDHIFKTMKDTEEVYVYIDGVYRPDGENVIKRECEVRLGGLISTHGVNEVIGHVRRSTYVDRTLFDADHFTLNLENGLFNTNNTGLRSHDPEYLSMVRLPLHYDPDAECPKIQKFLVEILNEKDIPAVLEFFGYCLYRGYPIHKSFMLVADGANGKSSLLRLLRAFLGKENCASIGLQEFEESRFATSALYNKMANISPDLPSTALQQTGKFKMLVGEDLIGAEKKFKEHFTYENYAKMIFSTNRIPLAWDDSSAFYRRWIIINFPNVFVGDKADKHLLKRLAVREELSGLLNLALGGMRRLLESGEFTGAPTIEEARETYVRMSDSVGSFIMDKIEISSEDWIAKGELYKQFCEYCGTHRYPVVSEKTFAKRLAYHVKVNDFRPQDGDRRVTAWRGIKFREEVQQTKIREEEEDSDKPPVVDLSDTCGRCGRPLGEDKIWVGMGLGHICKDCEKERTDEYFGR